jgi:hypothetical protein
MNRTLSLLIPVLTFAFTDMSLAQAPKLKFEAPKGWKKEQPSSRMRYAQFRIPSVKGGGEDATLAVFHFAGGGGGVQANLDRWIGQMRQPDGSSSKDKVKITKKEYDDKTTHTLKVSGIFMDRVGGPFAGKVVPKKGYRMVAVVLVTKPGNFYFKWTGPEATVRKWEEEFEKSISSTTAE